MLQLTSKDEESREYDEEEENEELKVPLKTNTVDYRDDE